MKQKLLFLITLFFSLIAQAQGDASFVMTPNCQGATATITGDTGGTFAFNPIPPDGATIDPVTGTATNCLYGETYTVEYTTSGVLSETSSETFTVFFEADASFFMTPTCDGAIATITGDLGGVFFFNPIPADGVTLDSSTGTVTNAVSGMTYTLRYATSGICQAFSIESFTVISQDDSSFVMNSNCEGVGATATITGVSGGLFNFNPLPTDNALINEFTGEITNGVLGTTYTVEYTVSGSCPSTSIDSVTISANPTIQQPNDMAVCSLYEFDVDFNLNAQIEVITGGATCRIVTFYDSLVDAQNATNAIVNTDNYNSYSSNPFTIYVRVEDIASGDFEITDFDLIVNLIPEIYGSEIIECINSTGVTAFTLSDMSLEITNGNTDYSVSYYASFNNAENETNALPEIYEVINNQSVYARVNSLTSTCYDIVECYLNVNNGVDLNNLEGLILCGTNEVAQFDLVTHVNQFINGNLAELTFYTSQEDAENETNSIFPADNYTNTSDPQTIFVRAQHVISGCLTYGSFILYVENYDDLVINAPTPLIVCDFDGAEDGLYIFDLSQKNAEILEGLSNYHFITYHETQEDADLGVNELNATQYYNTIPNLQTIFVRVINPNIFCPAFTTLDLIVDTDCQVSCEENVTFCYGNNNTTQYTYSNDNGVPMTVIFNAGQVEVDYDQLVVLDSDGVTNLNATNPYGNNGDITGLTFTSTGDTITIYVQSDGSISCETDNYVEIDFNVFCYVSIGSIEVNAFLDENSDTLFDASEVNFSNGVFSYEVNNDGITNYVNSSSGSFIIPNSQEGDTYDIGFIMFDAFNNCLAQTFTLVEDVVAVEGDITEVNFPLTSISECNDIAVYLLSNAPPRPGIIYNNTLVVENLGIGQVSGAVEFTYDATITLNNVYNVDSGNTITNTATGFILNFNNLLPRSEEQVNIQLNIPTNLNIGDLITNSAIYNVNDINLENNESVLTQEVVNSYDPNNKLESHGPEIKLDDFTNEDYLYYTINFQNLGTAEALDIRVEDVLDAQLDASTFKMLNASHDYMLTRVNNNLTWQFEDINLPSESMDEPNSHGFVYFKIKPLAGYQDGDIIPNVADIYFDFNPAITTNTFETKFVTTLSVGEFSTISYTMYPNPANSTVNIEFNNAVAEKIVVSIYNVQGKLVNKPSTTSDGTKLSFNVSHLSQGMYFVALKGESFNRIEKLIVK